VEFSRKGKVWNKTDKKSIPKPGFSIKMEEKIKTLEKMGKKG